MDLSVLWLSIGTDLKHSIRLRLTKWYCQQKKRLWYPRVFRIPSVILIFDNKGKTLPFPIALQGLCAFRLLHFIYLDGKQRVAPWWEDKSAVGVNVPVVIAPHLVHVVLPPHISCGSCRKEKKVPYTGRCNANATRNSSTCKLYNYELPDIAIISGLILAFYCFLP